MVSICPEKGTVERNKYTQQNQHNNENLSGLCLINITCYSNIIW